MPPLVEVAAQVFQIAVFQAGFPQSSFEGFEPFAGRDSEVDVKVVG